MDVKVAHKVGDRVDQMCLTCNEERGHIVVSMTKTGRITRVGCPMCESRVIYRAGTTRRASAKPGAPYDRTRTYRKGQTLTHPTFGEGEVTASHRAAENGCAVRGSHAPAHSHAISVVLEEREPH